MKLAEWIDAVIMMRGLWPNAEIPDNTVKEWHREVADLDAAQVVTVIRTFSRDGDEWPPTGGKIRHRVAELILDAPEWGEVLEQLREIQKAPPEKCIGIRNEHDLDAELEAVIERPRDAVIAGTHPMIVAFLLHVGTQVAIGVNPDDGGDEARLREKWFAFKRTAERRLSYTGLDAADLPALVRGARRTRSLTQAEPVFSGIRDQIARHLQLPAGQGEVDVPTKEKGNADG